jgi:4-hydroxy-tetrahydrodipicolinate synthase
MVDGKVPVVMNIAEQTTKGAILAAEKARKNGASGLMMLPPMRYKAGDHETVTYYKAVANSTDLPMMVYNNPVDYKIEVTLDMFEELSECENIQAVKESTRDISNITRMKNRFGDRFSILSGVDTLALESLFMGANGWVAGLVCAFPAETVAIYRLHRAGRYEEALKIYRWFLPLLELDINAKLVQNIKLAEVYTEIGTETVRAPRLPLMGAERAHVIDIIETGIKNRTELPDYLNL